MASALLSHPPAEAGPRRQSSTRDCPCACPHGALVLCLLAGIRQDVQCRGHTASGTHKGEGARGEVVTLVNRSIRQLCPADVCCHSPD